VNISPDPKDSYFADGLTEELISALSEVRGLRVIARTSVDRYKNAAKSAKEIGTELRVSHLLEGSVRKAGNRIRMAAHLVDTVSQEEVWSYQYEKDLVDVFSIQSDIAARVAESLKVRLVATEKDRIESKETENIAAYVAYLKGRSLLRYGTEKSLHLAREQFDLAIREDESYAKAYAGMADTVMLLGDYLFSPIPVALEEANTHVRKALALDPNLAEARVSLGTLLLYDYRFDEAEKELRRAIETNPSYATGHHWYSICLQSLGRREDALRQTLIAEELDPLSPLIALTVVYRLVYLGRFEEAKKRIRKLQEIDRESPLVDEASMVYNLLRGDWDAAMTVLKRMIEHDPADPYLDMDLAYIYAMTGRRDEALKIIDKLKNVPEDLRIRGQLLAFVYLGLGDNDAVFEWLNYAFSKKEFFFSWIRGHLIFDPIRKDPRYQDLLKAANLPPD
jgi:TolB-like protein/Flp pilus assembly protein TadD